VQNAFTVVGALAFLVGCGPRPYEMDEPEIAARYAHKYADGECTSWLTSARTGFRYCASPPIEVEVPIYAGPVKAGGAEEDLVVDMPSLMNKGEEVYGADSQTCHQANGKGVEGLYPPLDGSGGYYGDAENHANIIVNGLNGEIQVQGVTYSGAMAPHGFLSDYEIAAVATYERNSWSNEDGMVTPEQVAAVR